MSDIRIYGGTKSVQRNTADSLWQYLRGTRDGSASVIEYYRMLAMEGRVFACNFGTVTTPLVTPATTAIAAQRPQAWIYTANTTVAILPIAARIIVESTGITTQGEVAVFTTTNNIGAGTSTAVTGITSLRSDSPISSLCSAAKLATGNTTAESGLIEHARFSFAASAVDQDRKWSALEELVPPSLIGGGSFGLYIGGNAVNFFASLTWAEIPATDLS